MKLFTIQSYKDRTPAYRAVVMVAALATIVDSLVTLLTLGWVKTHFQAKCVKLQLRAMSPAVMIFDEQTFHNLRTLYIGGMLLTILLVWFTDLHWVFILPVFTVTAFIFYITAAFSNERPS